MNSICESTINMRENCDKRNCTEKFFVNGSFITKFSQKCLIFSNDYVILLNSQFITIGKE